MIDRSNSEYAFQVSTCVVGHGNHPRRGERCSLMYM